MRHVLFAFTLLLSLPAVAAAQDDSPLIGSEGSGVIHVSMTKPAAHPQEISSNPSPAPVCASQGCPLLLKAAMATAGAGQQP